MFLSWRAEKSIYNWLKVEWTDGNSSTLRTNHYYFLCCYPESIHTLLALIAATLAFKSSTIFAQRALPRGSFAAGYFPIVVESGCTRRWTIYSYFYKDIDFTITMLVPSHFWLLISPVHHPICHGWELVKASSSLLPPYQSLKHRLKHGLQIGLEAWV